MTLAVARRLKSALESRLGVRVILTRDADATVELDERASLANNNKADLFVSLHANASVRGSAAGAEVFYLSLDEYGDQAQRVAQGETEAVPVFGGGTRDVEVILWEMAQARYIEQSAALAQAVEAALRERVPMSPRAIQQAPFRVLVGANMPAVLVEMGFITNAEQEKLLGSDGFQTSIVQAIVDSIIRYRDRTTAAVPAPARRGSAAPNADDASQPGDWSGRPADDRRRLVADRPRPPVGLVARHRPACPAPPDRPPPQTRARSPRRSIYVSEDGMSLAGVQREVPFGEGVLEQARQIVTAQLGEAPAPLASAIPKG